eukprot:8793477-Lingulodinium_polyedra.AAC.1
MLRHTARANSGFLAQSGLTWKPPRMNDRSPPETRRGSGGSAESGAGNAPTADTTVTLSEMNGGGFSPCEAAYFLWERA